jgi:hypothetical protein
MNRFLSASILLSGLVGLSAAPAAAAEGDVNSQAYAFTGLSDLAPTPKTYGLADYSGKVRLLVVFQYNCGGCVANAPKFGRLVDTLEKSADSARFQAIGAEINNATYANILSYRGSLTNNNTLTLDFPLVKVPFDTAIANDGGFEGTRWKRYNSRRDTYFVIDHNGKITARIAGNRSNAMHDTLYRNLRTALTAALAAAPANLASAQGGKSFGVSMTRQGRAYRFELGADAAPASLQIHDLQGRAFFTRQLKPGSTALWNGTDAAGKTVPYGVYFVKISRAGVTESRRISYLP